MHGPDSYPGVADVQAERKERMRLAAVHALQVTRNGRDLDPDAYRWALHWASQKPLGRPLSKGEPCAK